MTMLMFFCRYIIFDLQESSKYLVAVGRDEDAIAVLEYIAKRNGRSITLTVEQLKAVSGKGDMRVERTFMQSLKKSFTHFNLSATRFSFALTQLIPFQSAHVKPLFSTKRLGINSALTILIWG